MTEADLLPAGARPRPDSLAVFASAWAGRRTGVAVAADGRRVVLVAGEGTSPQAPTLLAAFICQRGLRFEEGAVDHDGLRVPLGGLVLEAARLISDPDRIRRDANVLLAEGRHFGASFHRLPLPASTRNLLIRALRSGVSLVEALRGEGLGPGVIADDLAALVALRLIVLRDVVPGTQTPAPVSSPSRPPGSGIVPSSRAAREALVRRLEREWATLMHADDWTVLGVPSDLPPDRIRAACRRMKERYAALLEADDLPHEARDLVLKLRDRVDRAVARVRTGRTTSAMPALPGLDQALRQGWAAVERGDLERGRRWFLLARREDPNSADALAGAGWVEVLDASSTDEARVEGTDLLRLAALLAPGDTRIAALLRRAAGGDGEI